jgi:hypothetical protein
MTEAQVDDLIDFVARNPLSGDVIESTGGLRKLRWRLSGRGKRGGARIIYYYHDADMPLYLLLAYSKSAMADVSTTELKRLTAIAEQISTRQKEKRR